MLLHFYSDVAYNMSGFNISVSVASCPSNHYQLICSGHGSCDKNTGVCDCDEDAKGQACELAACPDSCGSAEGRGECNKEEKVCECVGEWRGEDCRQRSESGWWEAVNDGQEEGDQGRTSHAAVVENGNMWVIGGEFLHKAPTSSMVRKWDFEKKVWDKVVVRGEKAPSERHSHSAVHYDGKIFIYGGMMRSGQVSKELWSFNLESFEWSREVPKRDNCDSDLCGQIPSHGHTATLVQGRMIIIFGHSPEVGYLNTVQEYQFSNN